MPGSVSDVAAYKFIEAEECLLDANIWLFVYGPIDPSDARVAIYSSALSRILKSKCKIHLDITLLSEYINRHARMEFDIQSAYTDLKAKTFKEFRRTPDFVPIAEGIVIAAKKIVQHCTRIESDFPNWPIEGFLNEFASGKKDFNDQIVGHACRTRAYTLVTDDGDFHSEGIKVVTANRKLLRN